MIEFRIESLYDSAWKVFGFQYDQFVADRDAFRAGIERRLGHDVAAQIQLHVDVSLGRRLNTSSDVPNPKIMIIREYYELLALEEALKEIERRISANAVFHDPDHDLLPTLGLSWQDVLPLLDGRKSPGCMSPENVKKFLRMVRTAEQRVPAGAEIQGSDEEIADYFCKWRRQLTEFLERAVKLRETVWCRLRRADPRHP